MRVSELCVVDLSEYELKLFFRVNRPSSSQAGDQCLFSPFSIRVLLRKVIRIKKFINLSDCLDETNNSRNYLKSSV